MNRIEMNSQRYSNSRTLRRFKNKILKKYQEDCSRIYRIFTYCSPFESALNIQRQQEAILDEYKKTFINMADYIQIVRLFLIDKDMRNVFDFYPNIESSTFACSLLRSFNLCVNDKTIGNEYKDLIKELIFIHNTPRFNDYDQDPELKKMFDNRELNDKLQNELKLQQELSHKKQIRQISKV